ncbi:MAG: hypothetical protein A2Y57_03685 [Candidatus Woykebacteria bacterium RBG_13_40_7b]|uniref:Peptidase M10 metallopeptidase domain-containing protein n=1 Tax=Candidatus Woykebacteria bacterium RBG_13_40_7b TaxID=1802594 RepID=A0A1G1W6E6_9BACT|nr:MAG: hypothetical protein A2Y57_03685 [Candidatus Woykebacteria bacterium RBG_13_40_7b]
MLVPDPPAMLKVVPLYVYPNDGVAKLQYLQPINYAMRIVQGWYAGKLQGKTFSLEDARVVKSAHNLDFYQYKNCGEFGSWEVLADAVRSSNILLDQTIAIGFIEGWEPSNCGGQGGGGSNMAEISSWAWDDFIPDTPYPSNDGTDFAHYSIQVVAHELGHAFGLGGDQWEDPCLMGHRNSNDDINECILNTSERRILLNNPFFTDVLSFILNGKLDRSFRVGRFRVPYS